MDWSATGERSRPKVLFVLERHLGHETFAVNLLDAASRTGEIEIIDAPIRYDTSSSKLPSWSRLDGVRGTLAGRAEVRRALVTHSPDLTIYNTQVPAALAGRKVRRPYVVVTDITPAQYDRMAADYNHRPDRGGPVSSWKRRVSQRVFARAAYCVAWSTWVAESLRSEYAVESDRIAVIPPGVDLDSWHVDRTPWSDRPDPSRVLFVGGDFRRKGGEVLLAAIAQLDGFEVDVVTKSQVDVTDGVFVHSHLRPNDPELVELYRRADIFVLPSLAEAFGIAAVEASAAGLPVVASRVGGLADVVVHERTGLLVEPGSVSSLASALDRLRTDTALRRRLGGAARAHAAEHFDADVNASRLLDLARSCLQP
jgi:glycosyltransferase involved in cell wall biosynthesis